jgi:hypothetical protein
MAATAARAAIIITVMRRFKYCIRKTVMRGLAIVRSVTWFVLLGLVPFSSAGTLRWPQACLGVSSTLYHVQRCDGSVAEVVRPGASGRTNEIAPRRGSESARPRRNRDGDGLVRNLARRDGSRRSLWVVRRSSSQRLASASAL